MSFKCYCESSFPPSFPWLSHLAGSKCSPFVSGLSCLQLLPRTAIVFVSVIRFAVSCFPKVAGTHFSTTLFLCSRKKNNLGKQQKHSSKGHRVTSSPTWSLFIWNTEKNKEGCKANGRITELHEPISHSPLRGPDVYICIYILSSNKNQGQF